MGHQMDKKLYRCRTETSVTCRNPEFGRRMGRGQLVDLAEVVSKNKAGEDVVLGDLVRRDCFEDMELPTKTPPPKKRGNK